MRKNVENPDGFASSMQTSRDIGDELLCDWIFSINFLELAE